jgi:hypothetical protein
MCDAFPLPCSNELYKLYGGGLMVLLLQGPPLPGVPGTQGPSQERNPYREEYRKYDFQGKQAVLVLRTNDYGGCLRISRLQLLC